MSKNQIKPKDYVNYRTLTTLLPIAICFGIIFWITRPAQIFKDGVKDLTGDSMSMLMVGICNYYGYGTEQNYDLAVQYFEKAVSCFERGANQGHGSSLYYMGYCYENGYGVDKSMENAIKYYQEAAQAGDEA